MHDPFTGNANPSSFYKIMATRNTTGSGDVSMPGQSRSTSSSHDQSMPDYSRSLSPASSRRSYPMPDYSHPLSLAGSRNISEYGNSAMNELGFSHIEARLHDAKWYQEHTEENQFDAMMASISPRKNSTSGISAPSNTRVSSAATTSPEQSRKVSLAQQDSVSSYSGHPRSVAVTTRDPPPPAIHVSAGDAKACFPFPSGINEDVIDVGLQSEATVKKKPVGKPKGRKEGKKSELGELGIPPNKSERMASTCSMSAHGKEDTPKSAEKVSDGKRKRVVNAVGSKIALEDRLGNENSSSPTRKVSKTGSKEDPSRDDVDLDDLTAEGVVSRVPLGEIENRM